MVVDRILQLIEYKGISKSRFYTETKLSNGFLDKVKDIGSSKLEQILNQYPEINPVWLLLGKGEMLLSKENLSSKNSTYLKIDDKTTFTANEDKPTYGHVNSLGLPKVVTVSEKESEVISLVPYKAAAGYLNGYADPEYIENLPTLSIPNIGAGTHRAFEIKGQSMSPTLHNSSIGIGRWIESFDDIRERRIYIVVTKDGVVAKRVLNRIEESGRLILISDNQNKKDYPNILLEPEEVLEMWYLRANLSFEFPEPDLLYNRVNDLEAKYTILEDKLNSIASKQ